MKRKTLFENIVNEILLESQESKSIDAAKKLYMQRTGKSNEEADQFVRITLRNDLPVLRNRIAGKFILGVTRMFLDGELNNANIINRLNQTLKYVASDAHVNEYDRNLNGLTAEDLIGRFAKLAQDDFENEKKEIEKNKFEGKSEYTIKQIDSFEEASAYSSYTDWCVTNSQNMFNSYTSDGMKQFYFLLKHGFENVKRKIGENCPLDEYGLSMIAVCIDTDGSLSTCTCRWNHENGGNDSVMNAKEVSSVIKMNIYEVCKPNNKWENLLNSVRERLMNGEDPVDVFDEVGRWKEGFAQVRLNEKWNFIDKDGNFLSEKWFDWVGNWKDGLAKVQLNNKYNFIDKDGNFVFGQWFDSVDDFEDGLARVKLNNKWNFIDKNGDFLFDQWFDWVGNFYDGFAAVQLNKKWNFKDKDGNFVFGQWFDSVDDFEDGLARVQLNKKWNLIDQNGNFLFDQWFNDVYEFNYGFAKVKLNGKWNFIDKTGKILSNQWFDNIYGVGPWNEILAIVQLNGKYYMLDVNGNITPVRESSNESKRVTLNDKKLRIIVENAVKNVFDKNLENK